MKKQLIKEAFRLQQLAGLRPINEIGFESTDQVYDSAIKDALENYAEENYEEGNIESVADVISLMQNDSTLANEVFERALGYVQEKLGNANREDFKAWFSDVAAPINEILPSSDTSRKSGLQKEYITSAEESITEAFQKAGIDLNKPVICISDFGSHSVDAPRKISGGKLLQDLEAERVAYLEQDPDFDQTEGIQFEYGPEPGDGLLGDDEDAVQGLDCKLIVLFSDSHLYEIWQAKGMSRGMQKEQEGGMNRRGNTKTYYTVNRYGVTEIVPLESLGFDGSEQWEEISGFDSDIIKKYYTDNDGTGKVVVDANTSEEEMLADLERIDDDLWM
jgi:hypothetical protein